MTDEYSGILGILIVGFGSGISVGMGSGTASPIIIPILTLLMGVSIHHAIGNSLFIDSIIGCTAGILFLFHGRANIKTILSLGIPGALGAIIGSHFTSSASETGLNLFLGLIVIFIGINFLVNGIQKNLDFIKDRINFIWFRENSKIFFPVFGVILGGLSGFLGIGVGGIIALILIFVIHTAIGTSLLIMSFIAGSGAIEHIVAGEIAWSGAIFAATGAVIGSLTGSMFANKISSDILGRILGGIILVLGFLITMKTILF